MVQASLSSISIASFSQLHLSLNCISQLHLSIVSQQFVNSPCLHEEYNKRHALAYSGPPRGPWGPNVLTNPLLINLPLRRLLTMSMHVDHVMVDYA